MRKHSMENSQAAWMAARALAVAGVPIAHVAAYEHQRVVLRSAINQNRCILRDARNIDSVRIARADVAKYEARLARMEGRATLSDNAERG